MCFNVFYLLVCLLAHWASLHEIGSWMLYEEEGLCKLLLAIICYLILSPHQNQRTTMFKVYCAVWKLFHQFRNSFQSNTKLLFLLLTKMPDYNNVNVLSFKYTACKRISNVEEVWLCNQTSFLAILSANDWIQGHSIRWILCFCFWAVEIHDLL